MQQDLLTSQYDLTVARQELQICQQLLQDSRQQAEIAQREFTCSQLGLLQANQLLREQQMSLSNIFLRLRLPDGIQGADHLKVLAHQCRDATEFMRRLGLQHLQGQSMSQQPQLTDLGDSA